MSKDEYIKNQLIIPDLDELNGLVYKYEYDFRNLVIRFYKDYVSRYLYYIVFSNVIYFEGVHFWSGCDIEIGSQNEKFDILRSAYIVDPHDKSATEIYEKDMYLFKIRTKKNWNNQEFLQITKILASSANLIKNDI
jgi:hypothetical protein